MSRTVSHMREHYHWMYGCCGIVGDFWFRSQWPFLLSWVIFLFKSAIKIKMNPTSEDALFSLDVIYCLPIDRSNLRWHKSSNLFWDSYVKSNFIILKLSFMCLNPGFKQTLLTNLTMLLNMQSSSLYTLINVLKYHVQYTWFCAAGSIYVLFHGVTA